MASSMTEGASRNSTQRLRRLATASIAFGWLTSEASGYWRGLFLWKEGVIDESGELNGEKYTKIERMGDGEFRVTLVDA